MTFSNRKLYLALLAASVGLSAWTVSAAPLQSYKIDDNKVSISGLSSGAYMAVQMGVAHSSFFSSIGVIAGGPYHCADTGGGINANLNRATGPCMQGKYSWIQSFYCLWPWTSCGPNKIDIAASIKATTAHATVGKIDPLTHLAKQKIYLFSGSKDKIIVPSVMNALNQYYQNYVPSTQILYKHDLAAAHTFPTESFGNKCDVAAKPFLSDCDYDAAGEVLKHSYGTLLPRNNAALKGKIIKFEQAEFANNNPASLSMDNSGFIFVPKECADKTATCKLHVALHGCKQGFSEVATKFVEEAGYNQWADTNRIIVLYPQAIASQVSPYNPNGCWDWWGYPDSSNWDTKEGEQIKAIKKMVDRVLGISF